MPGRGELVIATVKKIFPYGAFCTLDEYDGLEAFLHVSEIAPRWIKNIREHVREGQKVIAQVHRFIPEKNQIDLTIKRVSESDRVWKREQYRRENRGKKLLENAAKKLKKDEVFIGEIAPEMEKAFGSIYECFEALSLDSENARGKLKVPAKVLKVLESVAKDNIKPQKVHISRKLKVECFESDGVERVRGALGKVSSEKAKVELRYIGAPLYKIDIESDDYKTAEKELERIVSAISAEMGKCRHRVEVLEDKD